MYRMAAFNETSTLGLTSLARVDTAQLLSMDATDALTAYGPAYRRAHRAGDGDHWLSNTTLLQNDHPRLRIQALRLTQLRSGDREKALVCYHFVRSLRFELTADPINTSSLDVLAANSGDCYSKTTLLTALLRSLAIPARVRVVQTTAAHMFGILNCDSTPIHHAFTEVLLGDAWQGVDSYVVDLPFSMASRARLLTEKRKAGYGVHIDGQVSWSTHDSSFGHLGTSFETFPVRDYGAFDDLQQFWRATEVAADFGWARKRQAAVITALANQRIRRLRV